MPDLKVLGGAIGIGALFPTGNQCGRIFAGERKQCRQGFGDPYVELNWSRSFGKVRPSKYAGAYPIRQGLSVLADFGVVFPAGTYDDTTRTRQVLSMGTNIWDFAPALGVTYTTAPILAEGTEFSAKLYWNSYVENPSTQLWTGDLVNVDFAVSERIGRWQVGLAGVFGVQTETDERAGTPLKDTEAARDPARARGELRHAGEPLLREGEAAAHRLCREFRRIAHLRFDLAPQILSSAACTIPPPRGVVGLRSKPGGGIFKRTDSHPTRLGRWPSRPPHQGEG